jgi:hypothetical protein
MNPQIDRNALLSEVVGGDYIQVTAVRIAREHKTQIGSIVQKLMLWALFNVLVALSPFVFRALGVRFMGKSVVWEEVLSDGELLLVAAAVASGAIGELMISEKKYITPKLIVSGLCMFCLIIASLCYAFIRAMDKSSVTLETSAIFSWSVWIFMGAFVAGSGCVILSEVK